MSSFPSWFRDRFKPLLLEEEQKRSYLPPSRRLFPTLYCAPCSCIRWSRGGRSRGTQSELRWHPGLGVIFVLGWLVPRCCTPCRCGGSLGGTARRQGCPQPLAWTHCETVLEISVCQAWAAGFLSFSNCPKTGIDFRKDSKRYVPCFWLLCFSLQNPLSVDKFQNWEAVEALNGWF